MGYSRKELEARWIESCAWWREVAGRWRDEEQKIAASIPRYLLVSAPGWSAPMRVTLVREARNLLRGERRATCVAVMPGDEVGKPRRFDVTRDILR